jgi:HK97 gp10 family phage protein
VNIEIEGLDELDRKLVEKLEEYRSELEGVVGDIAEGVRTEAQSLVPVDTGTLRDAIGVHHEGFEAEVGVFDKDAYYGRFIEFGTVRRPSNPFLGPAAEMERGRVVERVREALK